MTREIFGVLSVVFFGCGGTGDSHAPAEKPEYFLGAYLGEPKEELLSFLGENATQEVNAQGEPVIRYDYKINSEGSFLTMTAILKNNKVSALVGASKNELVPVSAYAFANDVCPQVVKKGAKFVEFGTLPQDGYQGQFKRRVDEGGVSIGCYQESKTEFRAVAATNDFLIVILDRGQSKPQSLMRDVIDRSVEFDWSSSNHFGEPIAVSNVEYVIDSVGKSISKKGTYFLAFRYTLKNISNETMSVMASDVVLTDARGRQFRPSGAATDAMAHQEGVSSFLVQIQPGLSEKQVAVFEVPEDALGKLSLRLSSKGMFNRQGIDLPFVF